MLFHTKRISMAYAPSFQIHCNWKTIFCTMNSFAYWTRRSSVSTPRAGKSFPCATSKVAPMGFRHVSIDIEAECRTLPETPNYLLKNDAARSGRGRVPPRLSYVRTRCRPSPICGVLAEPAGHGRK